MKPGYLTTKGAAAYLGISPQTIYNWNHTGSANLPTYKVGGRNMYKVSDLDEFMEAHKVAQ